MSDSLLWFFSYAFASLAWFALVVWLCIVLYRFLRLPALPWIACRYVLAFLAWIFTGYAFRRIFPAGTLNMRPLRFGGWSLPPGAWIPMAEPLIAAACDLLVALLALSEVAFLVFPRVSRCPFATPDISSGRPRPCERDRPCRVPSDGECADRSAAFSLAS